MKENLRYRLSSNTIDVISEALIASAIYISRVLHENLVHLEKLVDGKGLN